MARGRQRWQPSPELRPFVKALGNDRDAVKKLFGELDRQAREAGIPSDQVRALKGGINDWVIDGLRRAERAGVRDWNSREAAECFGFDPEPEEPQIGGTDEGKSVSDG